MNNANYSTTPSLDTPHFEGPDGYQDTHEGGARAPVLDSTAGPPPLHSFFRPHVRPCLRLSSNWLMRWQALDGLSFFRDDVPDTNANYNGAGVSCFESQHAAQCPPTPPADIAALRYRGNGVFAGPIHLAEDNPAGGRFHLDDQSSSAEPNNNHDLRGRESPRLPDTRETRRLRRMITGSRPHSDHIQTKPMVTHTADALGRADPLLPRLVGVVANGGASQVPTESPPLGIKNVGIQHPTKRKRATTSGGSREIKRPRSKKTQPLDALEMAHVSDVGIGPVRKRFLLSSFRLALSFLCSRAPISAWWNRPSTNAKSPRKAGTPCPQLTSRSRVSKGCDLPTPRTCTSVIWMIVTPSCLRTGV